MKKLIGTVAVAALLATAAFAEINFGAWLRVLVAPVAGNGDDVGTIATNAWAWGARTARLDISATSEDEKAGFIMGVYNDFESGIANADNAYMWIRPIEQIKISVGKFDAPINGLRGDFTYGSWAWIRPFNWLADGEGLTFTGVANNGLMVQVFPVEGLQIMLGVPIAEVFTKAEDVYKKAQVAAGYTIGDIGTIKAQWIGMSTSKVESAAGKWVNDEDKTVIPKDALDALENGYTYKAAVEGKGAVNKNRIEAAFDLTAVENLFVTIGAKFDIVDKKKASAKTDSLALITAGASYQIIEPLKVSLDGGVKIFHDSDFSPRFFVGVGVDYAITDVLAIMADFRYLGVTKYDGNSFKDDSISFLLGLDYTVGSNIILGVGFQGVTNGHGFLTNCATQTFGNKTDKFAWAVPVKLQMAF